MSDENERIRVELTRCGDGPISAHSLSEWLYQTDIVRGIPEVYRVELEIDASGLRSLERMPGLSINELS